MQIIIEKQTTYDLARLKEKVDKIFGEFKIEEKLAECRTVLLKPNLLGAYEPERAVTTHPVVVEAVIKKLQEMQKEVWLGDSPGGTVSVKHIWAKTGIGELCERYQVKLINFSTSGVIEKETDGERYPLARDFFAADAVINLAKYKTHSLMYYTGCIKNLYGLVPGLKKSEYHSAYPTYRDFSKVISDIYSIAGKRIILHILDGITGMEGEGPSAGEPRDYGLLMASESGAALDLRAARMLGFKDEQLGYIYTCLSEEGIKEKQIETAKEWQNFIFKNVKIKKVSRMISFLQHSPRFLQDIFRKLYYFYPAFKSDCRLCGVCRDSCPVQAITIRPGEKVPEIDHKKCIKCMCCHELCPYNAVYIHKSLLARFIVH